VHDRFQSFVRLVVNPHLTAFCTRLIGIWQADADSAPLFPVAADALRAFVAKHQLSGSAWMNWGAYDRKQFERSSVRHGGPLADRPAASEREAPVCEGAADR
jgi:inhibitor of KinA sporulation pathway (predicted exonuclease)